MERFADRGRLSLAMTDDRGPDRTFPSLVSIAVLVDLMWRPDAGGHVKCWERLAEAAVRHPADLDLTVHFEAERDGRRELAPNVRYILHRPILSTSHLPFLSHVPDHTDLAPSQPRLKRHLGGCAVIHTTDAYFAFAGTAERLVARYGLPLVHSVHTDTPGYTRIFTAEIVERLAGSGLIGRWLNQRLDLPGKAERSMLDRLARHQSLCRFVLASRPADLQRASAIVGDRRVRRLRRGVDHGRFAPQWRDRHRLRRRLGVPFDAAVVLFVGRMNRGKNILALAEAVRQLVEYGLPVHLLCIGDGEDRERVASLLGPAATCPGTMAQQDLAWVYASADIFALPSLIEIHSNVVQEALCSGLPAVISADTGLQALFGARGNGVLVAGTDAASWAETLRPLVVDRSSAAAMGRAGRQFAEAHLPSWDDVLVEDLLPVWREAAATAPATAQPSPPCRHRAS